MSNKLIIACEPLEQGYYGEVGVGVGSDLTVHINNPDGTIQERQVCITSIQGGDSGDLAGLVKEWRERALRCKGYKPLRWQWMATEINKCADELEARTAATPLPTEAGQGQQKE